MNFETVSLNNIEVMAPQVRRLDASEALLFRSKVLETINQNNKDLLLDFSWVDFIDSSCLGALVAILKAQNGKGIMSLCSLNSNIMAMFKLTRMDRVFTIYPDRESALNSETV